MNNLNEDQQANKQFIYGLDFNQQAIKHYLFKQKTVFYLKIIMGVIAVAGFFGLVLHLLLIVPHQQQPWWQAKSLFLLLFYLSLWFDGYLLSDYWRTHYLEKNKIAYLYQAGITNIDKKQAIFTAFNQDAINLIQQSFNQQQPIVPLRLARNLLYCDCFRDLAIRLNLNTQNTLQMIENQLQKETSDNRDGLENALIQAFFYGQQVGFNLVDSECLLAGLYQTNKQLQEIFFANGISEADFTDCLNWREIERQVRQTNLNLKSQARWKKIGSVNASYTSSATPLINQIGTDLTAQAKAGQLPLCLGRDKELAAIFQHLQSGQQSLLLVGQDNIGKLAIFHGLAQAMVQEKVPEVLFDKRLISLDINQLLHHDKYTPDKLLLKIFQEAQLAGNVFFVFDNLAELINNQAANQLGSNYNLVDILLNQLEQKLNLLATCNLQEYQKFIAPSNLASKIIKMDIAPPDDEATLLMLQAHTPNIEDQTKIKFSFAALKTAIDLTNRYQPSQMQPYKALNVLQLAATAGAQKCLQNQQSVCLCQPQDIAQVVSNLTHIPSTHLTNQDKSNLLNLEAVLKQEIIGQDEAVSAVAGALKRARADLQQNYQQPLASFLFLGPTGVGKTALALATAKHFFTKEAPVIRLDMSEYQQHQDIDKLLGSSDGGNPGLLTSAVKKQPFALILLDEIEKAHADILNLFLQILDEGRLTSGTGEVVSFADTVIVATSNAAAVQIQTALAQNVPYQTLQKQLQSEVLFQYFRPELLNRFDEIVIFKPLESEHIQQIIKLALDKIQANLDNQGIKLSVSQSAIAKIASEQYDRQYGARNIQHYLKSNLENQIANLIIADQLQRRDQILIDENLHLKVQKAPVL